MAHRFAGGNIVALGRINVPTAGTNTVVTGGITNILTGDPLLVKSISIQADPANLGNIYVGVKDMDATAAAFPGVLVILAAGQQTSLNINDQMNGLSLTQIFLDADNSDEGALVAALRV